MVPPCYLPGPNYGGGNEDNGDLPQKTPCMHCYSPCPQSCSRPPPTHTFTRDSWTPTGKSGTVSCGITAPFSWVLVHKALFLPSKGLFPQSCVSSGSSMVGLMSTSSKRAYAIPRSISSSVIPFSSHLQSFTASGSFHMSQFFTSGGQNIGTSASVLPMNIQG